MGMKIYPSDSSQWWLAGNVMPWDCVAAYQPKGALDLANSYVNLARPGTYNATPGVAPTWDVGNGWVFNGSSQYLTIGIIPKSKWSYIIRVESMNGGYIFGNSGNTQIWIGKRLIPFEFNNHAYAQLGTLQADCVYGISDRNAYQNGSFLGALNAPTVQNTSTIFIGARNYYGAPDTYFNGHILAAAFYSEALTASQVVSITSAMQAL